MSTTSRTTAATSSPPIPISPFTICSAISEATSDDIPDLGAFHTVLREWNHLQPPLRIPRMYPSSNSTITTTQTLPTYSQTPIEGSTVWNHLPLDSYLVSYASTTPGADTRASSLSPPPQSASHLSSPPHHFRSHSDGEFDYGCDDGTESARTVEINSERDFDFDDHELSMELTPAIQIKEEHSGDEREPDDDFQDPDAPSLGYLDGALSFIAAERARWAAQRETSGVVTSSSSANLGLALEARKGRRWRRRPSKHRGMDGESTALSTSSMGISQTTSPITRTTSSSQQEGSSEAESYTQRLGTLYPSVQGFSAILSQRSLVEGVEDVEYSRNQAYLSRPIYNCNASSPSTPHASKVDVSDSFNYGELQHINSGLDSGSTLRNARSTPHLRPRVVEESESSAADSKEIVTKQVLSSKGGLRVGVLGAADPKALSSSLHYNKLAMLSPSAPTSMTASNPTRSIDGDSRPTHAAAAVEVDSSKAAPFLDTTTISPLRRSLALKEQQEKFQRHLREYRSKPKAQGTSETPGILPSQTIQRPIGHHRSKSVKSQKSSFSGSPGSFTSPIANNAVRLGDDETIFSSLSSERRWKLLNLTKKLVQAFPEDKQDLGRLSRHLAGNKVAKKKVRDESGSGVESARLRSEDEILLKSSSKTGLSLNEGEAQQGGGSMIHVFIDHSNILIGLLSYLKRHPIQKKLQRAAGATTSKSSTSLSTICHQSNNVYNNIGHNTQDTKTRYHYGVEYASLNTSNTSAEKATHRTSIRDRGAFLSTEEEGHGQPNKHQHTKRGAHKSTHYHDFVQGIGGELGFVNAVLGNSSNTSAGTHYHSDSGRGWGGAIRGATETRKKRAKKIWHAALALILERGRPIHRRVLVTSSPLYQPLDAMERLGYEVRIYLRVPDFGNGMDRDRERFRAGLPASNIQWKLGAIAAGGRSSLPSPSSSPSKQITSNTGGSMRGKKSKGRTERASIGGSTSEREGITIPSAPHGHRRGNSAGTTSTIINLGISPLAPQRIKYREQGVDELLQLKLHQALAATDEVPAGSTIILATGDGNVGQFNEDGFLGPVRTALRRGWKVELVAWEGGLSRAWKREFGEGTEWWEKGLFRVIHLEQFVNFLVDADDELI